MDLGTIKRGIEAGKYETVDEVAHDIRLVWTNCMLYNRDGSEVSIHEHKNIIHRTLKESNLIKIIL